MPEDKKKAWIGLILHTKMCHAQPGIKGEGHSRNGVFFEIANKKIALS